MLVVLLASLAASIPAPRAIVGSWVVQPVAGVRTFDRLTFSDDGRVVGLGFRTARPYTVSGNKVTVPSRMGTLTYELTEDGRLCAPRGNGFEPAAGVGRQPMGYTVCYRKVVTPT